MKKFLSLVLALVMAMSLVTVSAGAKDFNDSDKISDITYEEAVNVMSEMGIIDGYADGNFQPQGTLTRGAAAKIIACMMLGKTTAESLGTQAAPFKDVPVGSTFAGYIAYCSESGIIDGYSDGTFRPSNTLTGFAFLKMLLTALGYDSAIEGYANNANWTVNVAGRAKQVGLLDGNDNFVGTRAATREEACLYAVNALQATLVEYENKGSSITINGATISAGASNATYVTSNVYDAATSINDTTDNVKNGWTVEFAEKYQPDLGLKDATDAFGRPAHTWTWKKAEIGTYVEYDKMVGEYTTKVTGEDLYNLLSKATIDDNEVLVYIDGEDDASVNSAIFDEKAMVKSNDDKVGDTGNGVLTQVFLDTAEDEITVAIINTYLAKADEDYNTKTEDLDLTVYKINEAAKNAYVKTKAETETMTVEAEDFSIADVKEDDLFLVTVADGEIQTMVAPEVVSEATVTNFKRTSYVTAGGTQYDYASTAMYDEEVLDQYDDKNMKDVTYNVILDPYGYLIGIELNQDPDQYVFLTGIDLGSSNLSAKNADANVIFVDGKMDTVTVNMKDSDFYYDSTGHNSQLNTWCTYTVDSKGVYTLEEVASRTDSDAKPAVKVAQNKQDVTAGTVTINQKNVSLNGAGVDGFNKVYGNDETVYLNVELDKINDLRGTPVQIIGDVESVTTGVKNVDIDVINVVAEDGYAAPANEIYTLYKNNGYIIAAVTIGENNGISASYAYITSDDVNREAYANDEWTWTREAVVDGKIVELKEVGSTLKILDELEQGKWYEVKYDANGNVRKVDTTNEVDADRNGLYDGIPFKAVAGKFINDVSLVKASVNANDTVLLADTTTVTKLTYKSGTLYTDVNSTKGFSVSPDVKVVLALAGKNGDGAGKDWFDDVDDSYTGYAGLEKALKDMNTQGAFAAGTVEVSALLKSGAATVIVINDKNAPETVNSGSGLLEGSYNGVSWNKTAQEFELRYYGNELTDSEIKAGISAIVGSPVEKLNRFLGYAQMENGDYYKVNFTQIPQVAISVDGTIVAYADKNDPSGITVKIPNGTYAEYATGDPATVASPALTVSTGSQFLGVLSKDRVFTTVYQVVTDNSSTGVTAALADKASTPVGDGEYVTANEKIVLTFPAAVATDYYKVSIDGIDTVVAVGTSGLTRQFVASSKVTVSKLGNYMSASDIQTVVDTYNPSSDSTSDECSITKSGNTLNIVVNHGTPISDVADTGLMTLASTLVSKGNTVTVKFANGEQVVIDGTGSNVKDSLVNALSRNALPTSLTVTVTNTASGESVDCTVNISEAAV